MKYKLLPSMMRACYAHHVVHVNVIMLLHHNFPPIVLLDINCIILISLHCYQMEIFQVIVSYNFDFQIKF
jgi:hypothetical protein